MDFCSLHACFAAFRVIATDIDNRDIQDLMKKNCSQNKELIKEGIKVAPLNFGDDLDDKDFLPDVTEIIAGDIIYDNEITEKFIKFISKLQQKLVKRPFNIHVALEKRFDDFKKHLCHCLQSIPVSPNVECCFSVS